MNLTTQAKPYKITKREVYDAWLMVKANRGAGGVDGVSLAEFAARLPKNLYKLWNRMSSGSYFPQAVRRVEIPKKDGSTRPLGIPTIYDRIAQEVVRARLEVELEPLFHQDSYGYRPDKSALDAIAICRQRSWKYDWVLDVDIQKFFDTIPHELLLKAVRKHCSERWMVLYIERWLSSPVQVPDGSLEETKSGTPQGGVISPLLANLYLHYAFDAWMERKHPSVKFERYADDIVIHITSREAAERLKSELGQRLAECGLELHSEKTKVVYCKDSSRKGNYYCVSYTFLGYTFQPRATQNRRTGTFFTGFLPAVSQGAQKHLWQQLRDLNLRRYEKLSVSELAKLLNPILRGWFNYFSYFYRDELWAVQYHIDRRLRHWARKKYRWNAKRVAKWLARLKYQQRYLFAHWEALSPTCR